MNVRRYILTGMVVLLFAGAQPVQAQCAMCKATAETNADGGGSDAEGLNAGIVYLMAMPYLLMGTVGFFWYRSAKKGKQSEA